MVVPESSRVPEPRSAHTSMPDARGRRPPWLAPGYQWVVLRGVIARTVGKLFGLKTPQAGAFLSLAYRRHNRSKLQHLETLGLNLAGSSVLEVGAGIGDHTGFFVKRGCRVVTSDVRAENLKLLRSRYPQLQVLHLDLDSPPAMFNETFDVVYCYGVLYHLKDPARAIAFMAQHCRQMLLLETCVSFGDEDALNPCTEDVRNPTQSISGWGCRPTRTWVHNQLKRHFEFVYFPRTQPNHEEYPLDWSSPGPANTLSRAIFIAARQQVTNPLLVEAMPRRQERAGAANSASWFSWARFRGS